MSMISGNQFSPKQMSIAVGDTVQTTNADAVLHNWTDPGVFDSGDLRTGQSFSWLFDTAGTFQFECTRHGGMTGSITVR